MAAAAKFARTKSNGKKEKPPEWDLGDLYGGTDDPNIEADLQSARRKASSLARKFRGRLAALDGASLGRAIAAYEKLDEALSRLMSFAQLRFAANTGDGEAARFYQTMTEKVTEVSSEILFFGLEINRIGARRLRNQLKSRRAQQYAAWIRDSRVFRPHQLDDDLEKLLHEKSVVGRASWSRLFDETMAGLTFKVSGRDLTSSEVFNLLSDPDRAVRKKAAKSLGVVFAANAKLFAMITNTLAKDKEIEDEWRKYPRPVSRRNLANQVEDEVVDALVASVKGAYGELSHRYYLLKAKWLGLKHLEHWDRNAPLPGDNDHSIPWSRAKRLVLDAYGGFDPKIGALAENFFTKPWIDARPRAGKDSGAFSHPTVPSAHPYILMNYHGRVRDVMTLAHELGHGVHQLLAAPQGHLQSDTPLTLAETASVFGEMLTFRSLLNGEKDTGRRRIMLASKVEDMINTVVRQVAFYDFECQVHDERRSGELSVERLGEIWLAVQRESLGPAFHYDQEYAYFWTYIPHFIHAPFYVYAYAFGDCLVNSLYQLFAEGHPRFQAKYLEMLAAGGTLRHRELLAPFGMDAGDPAFWQRGLGVISGFIDELEEGA